MRPFPLRTVHVALTLALAAFACGGFLASGCGSAEADPTGGVPDAFLDGGGVADTFVQVIDVNDDVVTHPRLCGEATFCDPDVAAICTPLTSDAGPDPGDADAADTAVLACRIVLRENRSIAACAPAGAVTESNFCASDDECAPGLACVGQPGLGRCLRYCCKEWSAPTSADDAGSGTHYCTPQPLAARPTERIPVWVKLDNCTLLDDELQCAKGTTCTVVTNDGRTTCVPAGTGRDYASCAAEPCDRGYVCLGTVDRRCRKLCRDGEGSTECSGGGYCQKVPTIPTGFGICAGGDAGS